MKKLYLILGVVLLVFGMAIIGSVYIDKKMENDADFVNEVYQIASKFDKEDSGKTTSGKNSAFETEVSEESVQLKNGVEEAVNPEKNIEGFEEIKMDGTLSEEDWQRRIDAGITAASLNDENNKCSNLYYYSLLDSFDRQLYLEMYIILKGYETNVCLCSMDSEKIDTVYSCVLFDHPEIFYSNGYVLTQYTVKDEVVRYSIAPMYTMEKEQAEEAQKLVDEYTEVFLQGIDKFASEYEKIKYTYEFVIINTEYELDSPENQNILSVMLYQKSVCQGYARAIQYLLSKLGVSSTIVSGYVQSGEGHAWNLVKCNNAYYYLDSTWGDSSYSDAENKSQYDISYDYLNITTADLEKNHIIDNIAEVPNCVFTQDNYYVKEGLMFNFVDENKIQAAFDKAYAEGKTCLSIKCATQVVYDDMEKYLIEDNHVFDYLADQTKVTYYSNDELLTYSIVL